jgi:predicted dehydrogenase
VAAEPEMIQNRGFNTLLAELEAFAAAIRGEKPYPITPEQVLHGVAVFEAIVRSAAEHRPVRVAR